MGEYRGKELELFETAKHWKKYFASFMLPYLRGNVLEVGAGIGGTTKILCDGRQTDWICLEPDESQVSQIKSLIVSNKLPSYCKAISGTLHDFSTHKLFDVILYIDVIEHIEKDDEELRLATQFLKPGGILIILVPALQWLFSPFDQAIGHYKRYTMTTLRTITPASMVEKKMFYLDGLGVFASLVNKFILKRSYPTPKQIYFWDRFIIPISKKVDFFTRKIMGRTLIGILEKMP
jgi:2-polyprenyl-3-methyl-5-hydroxy-6-metoxy-1,4-benzoquinol methylase